jgi:hypothetical protein
MKKVFLIAFFSFFGIAQAQVTFRPGLRGGVNLSYFTKGESYTYFDGIEEVNTERDFSSKTDFYLGFYGALRLTKYYTLQPEFDYTRQGSKYTDFDGNNRQLDVSYLSMAIANKFTFSDKFNVHFGPTIDFQVENNFDVDSDVDLAFFLGAGYNFNKNFGIEIRAKKGIIPVLDFSESNHTNVVFSLGTTYTFDTK